jgi:hypothetical protein
MSHTILLIDSDETTTAFLADRLATDGYQPAVAHTLRAAYDVPHAGGHRPRRPDRASPRARAARRHPRRRAALLTLRPRSSS